MGKIVRMLNKRLKIIDKFHYQREQYLTYLTTPEWFHAELAVNLAHFLQEKKSIFQFPYFYQTQEFWKISYQSYKAVRKHKSFYQILNAPYTIMVLFTVFFTMGEFIIKGFIALILNLMLPKENDTQMQSYLAQYYMLYAKDIETKPFFTHEYKVYRLELKKKYKACTSRSWTDWFAWKMISIELILKQLLVNVLLKRILVLPEKMTVTNIVVRFNADGVDDPNIAIELFLQKCTEIGSHLDLQISDEIYAKPKQTPHIHTPVYARFLAYPLLEFRKMIQKFAEKNIYIRRIEGQDYIQVKCHINVLSDEALKANQEKIAQISHVTLLYTYKNAICPNQCICLLNVPTIHLDNILNQLEVLPGTQITFMHYF